MIRFTINRSTTPAFTPVTVTLVLDSPDDLTLVTNLFGGVPSEAANANINELAAALRTACDNSGIAKSSRKLATGYNWGKKLRECLADAAE